jgi:hypothetical protein
MGPNDREVIVMQIDIDEEAAKRPLTNREKIALWFLILAFTFVLPAKYSHQVKELINEIKALM